MQFYARSSLFISQKMGQESYCMGISKAVVKEYDLLGQEVLWAEQATLHLVIQLFCLDINSLGSVVCVGKCCFF